MHASKHGAPFVADEDVPEDLKSTSAPKAEDDDVDSNHFMRWDWVLSEMIWAFEQKLNDDSESQFFDHSTVKGLPWDKDYVAPKVDWDGLKAHQERMANGFRLFGKYYQGLWD